MFAAATSFFSRTAISQSYNIGGSATGSTGRSGTPAPDSSTPAPAALSPPFNVGLWRIQPAVHKVTNKRVSVWSFDRRGVEMERAAPLVRDSTLEMSIRRNGRTPRGNTKRTNICYGTNTFFTSIIYSRIFEIFATRRAR